MKQILSQEEVDSLLAGIDAGDIDTKIELPKNKKILPYNFTSQDKTLKARMPTFDIINDRLSREIRSSISTLLPVNVNIKVNPFETLKFSNFVKSLPVPTNLNIFRMEPLRGYGLFILESKIVHKIINTFCGGRGLSVKERGKDREFTRIENVMIEKIVQSCLKDIETAWSSIVSVKISFVRAEMNPQFAGIVLSDDFVFVNKFEIDLDNESGSLMVCLPYSMIEPLKGKLTSTYFKDETEKIDSKWSKILEKLILESLIDLKILLGTTEILGKDLLYMQKGDVIKLDQNTDEKLIGYVDGLSKFKGYAGTQRGFQAFKIEEKLITK